jgi:ribosome-associated translation inhibitor RaiA
MEVETKGKDPDSRNSDGQELKLGGNIVLAGFSLDPAEMIIVKKIVGHYAKKISEKTEYREIKITLKQTQKQQSFLHKIDAKIETQSETLTSEVEERNLYSGLSDALENVYNQAVHKEK